MQLLAEARERGDEGTRGQGDKVTRRGGEIDTPPSSYAVTGDSCFTEECFIEEEFFTYTVHGHRVGAPHSGNNLLVIAKYMYRNADAYGTHSRSPLQIKNNSL
ncbi:MAG: hypothetical protein U7127_22495 [Phormidium sp.]